MKEKLTSQGYSFGAVNWPPTIRFSRPRTPQTVQIANINKKNVKTNLLTRRVTEK